MTNNPVFDSIQQLLREGDTGQALQVFIAYLEKEGSNPEALHGLRVIEANFNIARQQEIKGILAFSEAKQEYSKTNDALLTVLEDLKSGRRTSIGFSNTGDGRKRRGWLPWLILGVLLLILGLLAAFWLTRADQINCPEFKSPGTKVMILPFQNLAESKRHPELSIQSRIRELTAANQLASSVEIIHDPKYENDNPDNQQATLLSAHCGADMIIWGHYELLETNAISVDINYAFTQPDWPAGNANLLFKNISEIKSAKEVNLTELDDAIFRICMALALREDRLELAEKWLNKIKNPNQRELEWKKRLEDR